MSKECLYFQYLGLALDVLANIFLNNSSYVGRMFVKGHGKPSEILTKLSELAGFAPDEEIDLFEVKPFIFS